VMRARRWPHGDLVGPELRVPKMRVDIIERGLSSRRHVPRFMACQPGASLPEEDAKQRREQRDERQYRAQQPERPAIDVVRAPYRQLAWFLFHRGSRSLADVARICPGRRSKSIRLWRRLTSCSANCHPNTDNRVYRRRQARYQHRLLRSHPATCVSAQRPQQAAQPRQDAPR
jgi:hypothetical protein